MKRLACALAVLASCRSDREPRRTAEPADHRPRSDLAVPPPPAPQPSPPLPAPSASPTPPAVARAPLPPLPDPLPGVRRDLTAQIGSAWRVAIGDLDADGDRELVVADAKELRVLGPAGKQLAAMPVPGGIQALVVADVDGDGRAEVLAGWGQTRDHMQTQARVTLHRLAGRTLREETVLAPETERDEITAIVPLPDERGALVAYFDSKYMVSSVVARPGDGGWKATPVASLRTATSYARGDVDGDGKPDLVVGRIYGDAKGVDGDAFVLRPDGTRTKLPSTRGMRSLAAIDGDGDGRLEVFLGDGWHQHYGDHAQGLLTWVRHGPGGFTSELVEDTPGQYAIEQIVPMTVDGKPVVVAVGSHYVRAFTRIDGRWRGLTLAGAARDIAAGDLDGKPGDELVIVGTDRAELVRLRRADWK